MKKIVSLLAYGFISFAFSQTINIELVADGFTNPVNIQHANDSRLFVVERSGYIKILNANGTVNSSVFLDMDAKVSDDGGERGLLGLVFHPNYSTNGYFYVNYTNNDGNTVISRYSRLDADSADTTSEVILLTINQPESNHNGGAMAFGPDGYLYIASGDGGGTGDPNNNAQNLNSLLGKLLRIDVDTTSESLNYAIPADNPFLNDEDATTLPEIWAYGLRNPWRFSFDKSTNDLWIADVGQGEYEEINKVDYTTPSLNYGWRCYEGINHAYNTDECHEEATITRPIGEYAHTGSGVFKCSITGGYRYRGTTYSNFTGLYFFADYCSGEIGVLQADGESWNMSFPQIYSDKKWSTFGEDSNGELYIAALNTGEIFKIIDSSLGVEPIEFTKLTMYPNPVNDLLTFDASKTSAPIKSIKIMDSQGSQIKLVSNINSPSATISTKYLANGFYMVEITSTNNLKQIKKLIKI